ncbi:hypothetical protein AURDEDRAFT_179555 [Auricularia subglabra TFB-10046 SS5]|nr:hypothetical protein AURDEDRAFT_179555 [Auricularia subglabra TFB-10046 SS5]
MPGDDDWMNGLRGFMKRRPRVLEDPAPAPVPEPAPREPTPPSPPPAPVAPKLDNLPEDILLNIAGHLDAHRTTYWAPVDRQDLPAILNLATACRSLRAVLMPLIFRTVEVRTEDQVNNLYQLCNGGDRTYQFLGPPPDAAQQVKDLYAPNCVPIADIWPSEKARPLLMQSIRRLVAGPREQYSMGLDLRFIIQMLPALRVFELYDYRPCDRMLDRIARILRSFGHQIERFVYCQGPDLKEFSGRYAYPRAFGDMESLREVELVNLSIGEAPWIWASDVGFGEDWAPGDEEKLGMSPVCIWYRPELVIREDPVRLPGRLKSLRFRNVEFEPPKVEVPPAKTIERLREYAPELLATSAKGKGKEVDPEAVTTWPPAVHPLPRLIQASATTLTELGLEGVFGTALTPNIIQHALRDVGHRLTKLFLRRITRVSLAVKLLALCSNIEHLVMDDNGAGDKEDETPDLLRAVPASVHTLELWPKFRLSHVTKALEKGDLRVAALDLQSERWRPMYSVASGTIRELIRRCEGSAVQLRLWETTPAVTIEEEEEEEGGGGEEEEGEDMIEDETDDDGEGTDGTNENQN